jgi:hypothetical protein
LVKTKQIEKFLRALYDNSGELGRSQLAVAVFHRNWSAAELDALLASPELLGLITVSRGPMRHRQGKHAGRNKAGRPSTKYTLSGSGWALLASGLRHGVQPFKINSAEVQRQFQLLVADQDPWAIEIARQCARGRAADAADERRREEAKESRRIALAAQKASMPKKARTRTEKDIESRRNWFAARMRANGREIDENGKWIVVRSAATPSPMLPSAPTAIPASPNTVNETWRYLTLPVTPTPHSL